MDKKKWKAIAIAIIKYIATLIAGYVGGNAVM